VQPAMTWMQPELTWLLRGLVLVLVLMLVRMRV
jgi:hypothetical protein